MSPFPIPPSIVNLLLQHWVGSNGAEKGRPKVFRILKGREMPQLTRISSLNMTRDCEFVNFPVNVFTELQNRAWQHFPH